MSVVNRQTIVIHRDLAGPLQQFSVPLNLQFTPTSVIVRTICLGDSTLGGTLHGIVAPWSNSVNQVIGVFVDEANNAYMTNPNTTFKLENPNMLMNGDVTFLLRGLTNTLVASSSIGKLALTLEFIQESEPEPKPVVADMSALINYLKDSKESFYGLQSLLGKGSKSVMDGATSGGSVQYLEDEKVDPTVKNALDQNVDPVVNVHPDDTSEEPDNSI